MDNIKDLQFLAEKIQDLQNAILYCDSNSPLRLNNTVINTYKVDENGCITFFIKRPPQLISQFDKEFPVQMNYFRKGKDYYLNVFGKARIIHDPEELAYESYLTPSQMVDALTRQVMIKVCIYRAEYHTKGERRTGVLNKVMALFSDAFNSFNSSRTYDFTPGSLQNYSF